ncbi:MAG: DUF2851 family protein [Bacteroidota bacterium]|nr:DUF2851 family protein [Bacteroidota bacterium]
MTEKLLQFIWQRRYFNHNDLRLESGECLQILSPGKINMNQGPDFLWATIRVGNTLWAGHVELHLLASGWERHAHESDSHYRNVILHVVWENDRAPGRARRDIPVLVLRDRVPKIALARYAGRMDGRPFLPCGAQLSMADGNRFAGEVLSKGWTRHLLEQRLWRRTRMIKERLEANKQDWAATAWWLLARNMGLPVNAEAFGEVAISLPLTLLARYRNGMDELEALILGQAGWKGSDRDALYRHLQGKHRLQPIPIPLRFSRMRPAHSPYVRLRQLAGLLSIRISWFTDILEATDLNSLMALPGGGQADSRGPGVPGAPGQQMKENIVINSCLPILYAYGCLRSAPKYRERALQWMEEIRAEDNARTREWSSHGVVIRHAADSQALMELKTCYCETGGCLDCAIGKALLRRELPPAN